MSEGGLGGRVLGAGGAQSRLHRGRLVAEGRLGLGERGGGALALGALRMLGEEAGPRFLQLGQFRLQRGEALRGFACELLAQAVALRLGLRAGGGPGAEFRTRPAAVGERETPLGEELG